MTERVLQMDNPDLSEILLDSEPDSSDSHFTIDSISKAAWAAKRYLDAKHSIEEKEKLSEQYKAKIDQWFLSATKEEENTMASMKNMLWSYAETAVANQKKSRTVKLPDVNLSLKKKPAKIIVNDDEMALSYCKATHPELVKTVVSLSKAEIKKRLQKGEIFPGISLVPGIDDLHISSVGYEPPISF